jgi:hypothetical protein
MSRPKRALEDRQRPLVGRPGARRIALGPQHRAQVANVGGDLGVVGPEARLVDPEARS